jgi:hypothetical protein
MPRLTSRTNPTNQPAIPASFLNTLPTSATSSVYRRHQRPLHETTQIGVVS